MRLRASPALVSPAAQKSSRSYASASITLTCRLRQRGENKAMFFSARSVF